MNAPVVELVIRFAVAMMATITAVLLWKGTERPKMPSLLPLLWFLFWVILATSVWRWFVLWLGFQTDIGHWSWALAWVQPINGALLFLQLLGVALLAAFHQRNLTGDEGG